MEYWIYYKMVDFICTLPTGLKLGVSVTRAMGFPSDESFTLEMARHLLLKKLNGLIIARNTVVDSQSFYRSILHIWCQSETVAELLREAYSSLDLDDFGLDIKGTILTICENERIYKDRPYNPLDYL